MGTALRHATQLSSLPKPENRGSYDLIKGSFKYHRVPEEPTGSREDPGFWGGELNG